MNNTILIIENEYDSVKSAFDAANLLEFENALNFININKAQDIDYSTINLYSLIFIDISLAQKSVLDGYGIIIKLISQYPNIANKIIIITGNNQIKEGMKVRDIDRYEIPIIIKPLGYSDIANIIKSKRA